MAPRTSGGRMFAGPWVWSSLPVKSIKDLGPGNKIALPD